MVKITIDKKQVVVSGGSLLIEVLERNGYAGKYCYNDGLAVSGNCRVCLVELEGVGKPVASCAELVKEGMVVYTESMKVRKVRESVLEFLLLNHPLDCPVCDQGGECDLQEESMNVGNVLSRGFALLKRQVREKWLGMLVKTEWQRCIECSRCVRYAELVGLVNRLGVLGRSLLAEVSMFEWLGVEKGASGNVVDLCPVGRKRYVASYWVCVDWLRDWPVLVEMSKVVVLLVLVLLSVAFMTVCERKWLSSIQRRRGPNVIGWYGVLQALADGVKLVVKESVSPSGGDGMLFWVAPVWTFGVSLGCWSLLPFGEGLVLSDVDLGVLVVLALSSLGIYGVLLGGYASNNKYAFYGGMRSAAQMISYEVSIGFILGIVVLHGGGKLNLSEIVLFQERCWNVWSLGPVCALFVISVIAETNRHPFDLPEAESELVSGYNVEYSGGGFALFFLGEYSSILLMSGLCVIFFGGGWLGPLSVVLGSGLFGCKLLVMVLVFIWARAAYPRYRYDQLLMLGWKSFLPLSLGWLLLLMGVSGACV